MSNDILMFLELLNEKNFNKISVPFNLRKIVKKIEDIKPINIKEVKKRFFLIKMQELVSHRMKPKLRGDVTRLKELIPELKDIMRKVNYPDYESMIKVLDEIISKLINEEMEVNRRLFYKEKTSKIINDIFAKSEEMFYEV